MEAANGHLLQSSIAAEWESLGLTFNHRRMQTTRGCYQMADGLNDVNLSNDTCLWFNGPGSCIYNLLLHVS